MFLTLLKKEIISHILTLRFGVVFSLILVLVCTSFFISVRDYQQSTKSREEIYVKRKQAIQKMMEEQKTDQERWERANYLTGRNDAPEVPRLSIFAKGLYASIPTSIMVTSYSSQNLQDYDMQNPLVDMFRLPDFVYVVNIALSLLALLFAFDAISGEKESGTLRLMMSYPVPRYVPLLAKWIGGYVILALSLGIASFAGIGYAWAMGAVPFESSIWPGVGIVLALGLLYTSVFYGVGILVSIVTGRSVTSMFVCLAIWVIWILVVPNLAPVASSILAPCPTVKKVEAEKRAIQTEIRARSNSLTRMAGGVENQEKISKEKKRLNEERDRRTAQWDRFYKRSKQRQAKVSGILSRLSPSGSWIYAATSLAKTGPTAYQRYLEARDRLKTEMTEMSTRARRKQAGKFAIDKVPVLRVVQPATTEALEESLNDLLLLFVINVAFFMAGFVAFLRYDVR